MTKAELLAALEPFTDEMEIAIGEADGFSELAGYAYGLDGGGAGWLILDKGVRVDLPRVVRARKETPADECMAKVRQHFAPLCFWCGCEKDHPDHRFGAGKNHAYRVGSVVTKEEREAYALNREVDQ